jgi:hypothetical protein
MLDKNLIFFRVSAYELEKVNITKEDIKNFENKYNIQLADDYIEFLLEYDGFGLRNTQFINKKSGRIENKYINENKNLQYYYSLQELIDDIEDETATRYDISKECFLPRKMIAIASGDGHDWEVCLSYDEKTFGQIYYWTDIGDEVDFLCNSFTELIEGYYFTETDDNGLAIGEEKIFRIE